MSDETEETIRRYVDTIAELRKENERLKAVLKDTTWQDHTDSWKNRALTAEQQLVEANKRLEWFATQAGDMRADMREGEFDMGIDYALRNLGFAKP